MTQIIAFSGRKGSGKNTAVNFIYGLYMTALGIVKGQFQIDGTGKLFISDIFGDTEMEGIFDVTRDTPAMNIFLEDNLNEFIRQYSFADLLKTEICMKILGLTYEQCYGTDEQKNSATHLMWEDMPGYKDSQYDMEKRGPMTAREVMQYVGTQIFRRMDNDVWVKALIRRITDENAHIALITDVRFPNEVEGIQAVGGKVVRLTRNPFPDDTHKSETALDKDNFDWAKFDKIIENLGTIDEQNSLIYKALKEWNLLPIELEGLE